MTYVLSDLHGMYDKYIELLKKINFSDDDTLYILGDICDRGPDSAKIFLDVMGRKNVFVIKGNHEEMAVETLADLLRDHKSGTPFLFDSHSGAELRLWFMNGGDTSVLSFYDESPENLGRIHEFIKGLPYYYDINIEGTRYILVHAGLGEQKEEIPLSEISKRDLLWTRPDFDACYFDNKIKLIVGHTPTFIITEQSEEVSIYYGKENVIAIDCGASYPLGGRLGCLCLETGEEFYV